MAEAGITNVFGKEMRNLIIILTILDCSFLIRLIYDSLEIELDIFDD